MPEGARPLGGATVCYVSTEDFSGLTRTMKQAGSVRDAGAQVVFCGFEERAPAGLAATDFRVETVPFGSVRWCRHSVRLIRGACNRTLGRLSEVRLRARGERALRDAVIATGADIVQAVDLPALGVAATAAERMGVPLVFDSHEMWTGFLDNPDLGMPARERRRLLASERRFAPRADAVFVVSDEMGRRMCGRYPLGQVLTIFNSPPGAIADVRPTGRPVRLVFHGSLAATKNVADLVRAMARLRGEATLDIHGAGLSVAQHELEALVAELGLEETVRLHGAFRYSDVLDVIAPYDVDVYTARMLEDNFAISLPNKVFDAICAGLAVAAPDFPAIRELIDGTGCGVCLDTASVGTIAEGLAALVGDTRAIDAMKARSVAYAPECRWETQGAKIVDCFAALLARRHAV